jgi:hypothetical protein
LGQLLGPCVPSATRYCKTPYELFAVASVDCVAWLMSGASDGFRFTSARSEPTVARRVARGSSARRKESERNRSAYRQPRFTHATPSQQVRRMSRAFGNRDYHGKGQQSGNPARAARRRNSAVANGR